MQYANYPTTDIRHVLPLLLPAFKKLDCKSQGKAIRQDLDAKIKAGHVDRLYTAPKEGSGKEIKHDWLWSRMGGWFQETGASSFTRLATGDDACLLTRYHSYRDGNFIIRSHQRTPTLSSHVHCSDPLGLDRMVRRRYPWCSTSSHRIKRTKEDRLVCRRWQFAIGELRLRSRRGERRVADDLQTLQEIGTMLRRGVCPYLFVLNNDGYEIERQIHGWEAKYNDIQLYDHQLLLPFLAGKKCKVSP